MMKSSLTILSCISLLLASSHAEEKAPAPVGAQPAAEQGLPTGADKPVAAIPVPPKVDEPYKPAWIGWLHLPGPHHYKSAVRLADHSPEIWNGWSSEHFEHLPWLPKGVTGPARSIYPFLMESPMPSESTQGRRHAER